MEGLDLPAHRVAFDFLDGLSASCDRKVSEQLTFDAFSALWGARLDSVDDRKVQRRIAPLLSDRRQDTNSLEPDVHGDFDNFAGIVTHFDDVLALLKQPVPHLRDVRADRYGIRTFLAIDDTPIKVEIVSEGRIPLEGDRDPIFSVPSLSRDDMFAEKLPANTERGLDRSTLSRDMIDIAMMVRHWGDIPRAAWDKARKPFGDSVLSCSDPP